MDLEFDDWVIRGLTPPDQVRYLRPLFERLRPEVRDAFDIRIVGDQIHFARDVMIVQGTRPTQ